MNIIAIDCGASFIKASRINKGKVITAIKKRTPSDQDEDKLLKSVNIIKSMILELSNRDEVVHLGFSNEMHGFVLADSNGNPVIPYISWQKEYGNRLVNGDDKENYISLFRKIVSESDINATGMPLRAGLPSVNLLAVSENELENVTGDLYFYSLGDYYIRALSGSEPYMHPTNAAGTGLYDVNKGCWSARIIDAITRKIDRKIIFPKIAADSFERCMCLSSVLEGRTLFFYPALGDQQAALLGSGLTDGDISLNFGTGAQISYITEKTHFSSRYQVRPFFEGKYINTIPFIPSGRALNVFFDFVKSIITISGEMSDEDIWRYINKEASNNNLDLLDVDLSFFENAITDRIKGSISSIGEKTFTLGNLFDSIYTQMTDNIVYIYHELGSPDINRVVISGGVINRNEYLREKVVKALFEDNKTDIQKEVFCAEDETAIGIATYVSRAIS